MSWIGIGLYIEAPKQIIRDKEFKKKNIDPIVEETKRFYLSNNRLPNENEFSKLTTKSNATLITDYKYLPDEFIGKVKADEWIKGTYAISVWRGEWNEGFISTGDKYILNNYSISDGIIGFFVGFGAGIIPILINFGILEFLKRKRKAQLN